MKDNIIYNTSDEVEFFNMKLIEEENINLVGHSFKKECSLNKEQFLKILEETFEGQILVCKSISATTSWVKFTSEKTKKNFVVVCYYNEYSGNYSSENNKMNTLHLYLYADMMDMNYVSEKMKNLKLIVEEESTVYIQWICLNKKGDQVSTTLKASPNKQLKDVYYPWIPQGIDNLYKKYEESSSPILIILGPPGLGKSSLIRNYIYKYNKKTSITYDAELMKSDSFFINFINDEQDLIILEDYDIFLQSRDEADNAIMNKFLNLSEGIVDIGRKKIIFTANIEKDRIDPALVRPGRCFDILEFSPYTKLEAEKVIEAAGLSNDTICQEGMTLAEIFNNKKNKVEKKSKVGFFS